MRNMTDVVVEEKSFGPSQIRGLCKQSWNYTALRKCCTSVSMSLGSFYLKHREWVMTVVLEQVFRDGNVAWYGVLTFCDEKIDSLC